jgi:hypothetical protein
MRVLEFLGKAQELERGIDLAREIGNFGWEHGCGGDEERLSRNGGSGYLGDCVSHDCGVMSGDCVGKVRSCGGVGEELPSTNEEFVVGDTGRGFGISQDPPGAA